MPAKESDILFEIGDYWVTNEGTKKKRPVFQIWKNGVVRLRRSL